MLSGFRPCDLTDYTFHGILQTRIPEWIAIPFSRGSSQPRKILALQADSLPAEPPGNRGLGRHYKLSPGLPGASDGKESTGNTRDSGSIPGWGRSSGEGNGNPLQYSCLENFTDRSLEPYSPWGRKESDTTERLAHIKLSQTSVLYFRNTYQTCD